MFPDEIIEILQKYQSGNINELHSINDNISEIINQLKSIRSNLSKELSQLIDNDNVNDKEQELLDDTKTIRNYIKSIQLLDIDYKSDDSLSNEISEELSTSSPIILKTVKLYLCEDNICPVCGCSMDETHTVYSENNYDKKLVNSYRCNCCGRFFVCDYVINDIDISKTNLQIIRDYYFKIPDIDIEQVIVLKNTLPCSSQHHTKDLTAKIPILNDDCDIHYVEMRASYCFECKHFTILKDDFDKISDIVTCKVIDETSTYKFGNPQQNQDQDNDVSILKLYGYNVQTKRIFRSNNDILYFLP